MVDASPASADEYREAMPPKRTPIIESNRLISITVIAADLAVWLMLLPHQALSGLGLP